MSDNNSQETTSPSEQDKLDMTAESQSDRNGDDDKDNDNKDNSSRPSKRARLDATATATTTTSNGNGDSSSSSVDPALLQHAKQRLSKWAARLFDPDRPRGLVQGPITIPLNDEFLSAFGKREKKFDQAMGRDVQVDPTIESEDDDDDENDAEEGDGPTRKKKDKKSNSKVKITNLAYRTTSETLTEACEKFGPLVDVKLILDQERASMPNVHNSGRGYITFEHAEDAQACIDNLQEVDGRPLRLSLALAKPRSSMNGAGAGGAGGAGSALSRYWDKDISTVCYRCGKVGHIEPNCTNPMKPKPCTLCGSIEHNQYQCPCRQICFNCGIPGHVSRDCSFRRGMPRRMICGICFQQGHHRLQCREPSSYVYNNPTLRQDAICMQCGKQGDFLCCKELKFFYGLKGLSCFNCGGQGHLGYECERPNMYQCLNNTDLMKQEIDRATSNSVAEQMEAQLQQHKRERGRSPRRRGNDDNNKRSRNSAKSMPPPQRSGGSKRERSSSSSESRGRSRGGGRSQSGRGYDTNNGSSSNSSRGGGSVYGSLRSRR